MCNSRVIIYYFTYLKPNSFFSYILNKPYTKLKCLIFIITLLAFALQPTLENHLGNNNKLNEF